jgi:hypothetical protein
VFHIRVWRSLKQLKAEAVVPLKRGMPSPIGLDLDGCKREDGVLVDLVQELDAADARLSFTDEHALNATRVQAEAKKLVDLSDANVDSPATAGKRVSERVVGFVRADEVASHACV